MKKIIVIFGVIVLLGLVAGGIYCYLLKNKPEESDHSPCLADDEFADYPIDEKYAKEIKTPKIPLIIFIRDSITDKEKFSFQINDIESRGPRPQLRKCGVYLVRRFNYDPQKTKQDPGYKEEIWRYRYDGTGESIFLLAEKDMSGVFKAEFAGIFQVDPNEKYLVLEKKYLGHEDYALILKDIDTLEDLFVLKLRDILAKNSEIVSGSFGLGIWLENGEYLCGNIFSGALDIAYGCIKAGTWETEIFPSPPDILAGVERTITFKSWYLAYVDIPSFTGMDIITEQIIEEAKRDGRQKNLFVYNLINRKKIKIASADPEWRFNIKWISDTELEYEMPDGEKKVYTIEE